MIAFVGAPFSPAYFRARRRSLHADPLAHCGFNVVVHGPGVDAWALTEYRGSDVTRERDAFVLGRNRIERDGDGIRIVIDERTSPWRSPIRGVVRLVPSAWQPRTFALDDAGRHRWSPFAPVARIEVELDAPRLRFVGSGYHDGNSGTEALEQAFAGWRWTRGGHPDGAALLYDVRARDGARRELGLFCDREGRLVELAAPGRVELGHTRWRLPRSTRADEGGDGVLRRALVDAPFYARAWIELALAGRRIDAMHEVVDLDRFATTSTQLMLPFRTRGVGWR